MITSLPIALGSFVNTGDLRETVVVDWLTVQLVAAGRAASGASPNGTTVCRCNLVGGQWLRYSDDGVIPLIHHNPGCLPGNAGPKKRMGELMGEAFR